MSTREQRRAVRVDADTPSNATYATFIKKVTLGELLDCVSVAPGEELLHALFSFYLHSQAIPLLPTVSGLGDALKAIQHWVDTGKRFSEKDYEE